MAYILAPLIEGRARHRGCTKKTAHGHQRKRTSCRAHARTHARLALAAVLSGPSADFGPTTRLGCATDWATSESAPKGRTVSATRLFFLFVSAGVFLLSCYFFVTRHRVGVGELLGVHSFTTEKTSGFKGDLKPPASTPLTLAERQHFVPLRESSQSDIYCPPPSPPSPLSRSESHFSAAVRRASLSRT